MGCLARRRGCTQVSPELPEGGWECGRDAGSPPEDTGILRAPEVGTEVGTEAGMRWLRPLLSPCTLPQLISWSRSPHPSCSLRFYFWTFSASTSSAVTF